MRILACGSRGWNDVEQIRLALSHYGPGDTLIAGAARGADRIAAAVGLERKMNVIEVPADWLRDGRSAGYKRNLKMLDMEPELVIAFWDGESRGTQHTMTEAKKRGISVRVYTK